MPTQHPTAATATTGPGPVPVAATLQGPGTDVDAVDNLIISVLKLITVLIFVMAAGRIAYFVWRRPGQLVLQDIINASRQTDLTPILPGLSALARQWLAQETNNVKHAQRKDNRLVSLPRPQAAQDSAINDLTAGIASAAPAEIKPLVQFLAVCFPPRGSLITATLQQRADVGDHDIPAELGVTFNIATLGRRRPRSPYTIWESGRDPDDARTEAVVPVVPASPEMTEACALYVAGLCQEHAGQIENAQVHYQAALQKQPLYPAAREALERVLRAQDRTVLERSRKLLRLATQWLAVQVYKQNQQERVLVPFRPRWMSVWVPQWIYRLANWLFRGASWWTERRDAYLSRHHHDVGILYLSRAGPSCAFCYGLAMDELQQAIKKCKEWWEPYIAIGDSYVLRACDLHALVKDIESARRADSSGRPCPLPALHTENGLETALADASRDIEAQRQHLLESAHILYDSALARVLADDAPVRKHKILRDATTMGDKRTSVQATRDIARRRNLIARAVVFLAQDNIGAAESAMRRAVQDWDITTEKKATLLFNAALYYGRLAGHPHKDNDRAAQVEAVRKARACLACSIVRDYDLRIAADADPDLEFIRTFDKSWGWFKRSHLQQRYSPSKQDHGRFKAIIQEMLIGLGWSDSLPFLEANGLCKPASSTDAPPHARSQMPELSGA